MNYIKWLIAKTSPAFQDKLKRIYFRRQILKGDFVSDEPEYNYLSEYISEGDWVLDIGANIGHYTKRFSELAGPSGRVIAFEPVPSTFAILAENTRLFTYQNVTLINTAVSDKSMKVSMEVPTFDTGLSNYYRANISNAENGISVLTLSYDNLNFEHKINFIKIDAEGHEPYVMKGLMKTIEMYKPTIIIETVTESIHHALIDLGYEEKKYEGSPNVVYQLSIER